MRSIATFLLLLSTSLYSCSLSFQSCFKKVQDLKVIQQDSLVIPLTDQTTLLFTQTLPKNSLKADPFLSLYLVKSSKKVTYPFKINKYLDKKNLAVISAEIYCIDMLANQSGLNSFGKIKKPLKAPAPILNSCCEVIALLTPKGVISKPFIEHFLQKGGVYGSLGVRLRHDCIVESVNPFVETLLQKGDEIITFDGKKTENFSQLNQTILFAKVGSFHDIVVLRDKKRVHLKQKILKRYGGGFVSDTFFETIGVYFDAKLNVLKSTNPNFKKGDHIFMVNSQKVATFADIRHALTKSKQSVTIGINRRGLDFFIQLKIKS